MEKTKCNESRIAAYTQLYLLLNKDLETWNISLINVNNIMVKIKFKKALHMMLDRIMKSKINFFIVSIIKQYET